MIRADPFHHEAHPAVVEQQLGARLQHGIDLRVGQADMAGIARGRIEIEPKRLADRQLDPTLPEAADSELGPLQVGDDSDRPPGGLFHDADRPVALGVLLVAAVGEVEAERVRTRFVQGAHRARARSSPGRGSPGSWRNDYGA